MNENLISLYLAEKSRMLTNMVLRRTVARGVTTHTSSSTRVVFQTKVVYQAKFFTSKQDVYKVGLTPKRMYTEVPLYFLHSFLNIIIIKSRRVTGLGM
jgi:hypothetical protein